MSDSAIHVHVTMDAKVFHDFAFFESIRLPRRWLNLVLFILVMVTFAVVNLMTDAALLFWICLAIGIVSPVVYLYNFRSSINKQVARFGLDQPKQVYTVRLSRSPDEQIFVRLADHSEITFQWADIFGVFRTAGYIYLYTQPKQVYILPNEQVKSCPPDDVWALCVERAPAGKARDMRSKRQKSA